MDGAEFDLFFVLSGFIIMHAHGDDFPQMRFAPTWRFAKLRFFRVYPLSAVVLALILALVLADKGFGEWYRGVSAGNLSVSAFVRTLFLATRWFLPGEGDWNQPVWSLSAEVLGYALFPFIAYLLLKSRSFGGMLFAGCASLAELALCLTLTHMATRNDFGQSGAFLRMGCCFFAGAAFYRARCFAPTKLYSRSRLLAPMAFSTVVILAAMPQAEILMPLAFSLLIFFLSFESGYVNRMFASGPALFLGRISFPLYLFHVMPLMWLRYHVGGRGFPEWVMLLILGGYILVCLFVSTLLHHYVEKPFHSLGRRWTAQRPGRLEHASAGGRLTAADTARS